MKDQLDIMHFADNVVKSDSTGQKSAINSDSDPFWDNAASSLLQALILFVKEFLPASQQTMTNVNHLFRLIDQSPDQINPVLTSLNQGKLKTTYYFSTDYDNLGQLLFNWAQEQKPTSEAVKIWNSVIGSQNSSKTWGSIIGILGAALARYTLSEVENLMNSNQLNFATLLKPKTAFFIIYDDADSSKNFISNTLYTQLFSFLYQGARKTGNKLPVKVRFFLDDFKNIFIPDFDDYLATARSRNISICMMLQDESQLRAKFNLNTPSVIGNCAAYLLTGTTDLRMARIAANRFSQSAQSIRLMDSQHFLLDVGGHITSPIRYDFHEHPHYCDRKFDVNRHFFTPVVQAQDSTALMQIMQHLPGEEEIGNEDQQNFADFDGTDDDLPTSTII